MSTSTPFLNLLKAAGSELVNVVTQINNNFDKIDSKALSQENRLGIVEGLSGVTNWKEFDPTFKRHGGVALNLVAGAKYGWCFRLGNLVFFQIAASGTFADGVAGTVASSRLFVDMPYAVREDSVAAANNVTCTVSAGGNPGLMVPTSDVDGVSLQFLMLSAGAFDWDGVYTINVSGWYNTDGTELKALTDA